MLVHLPCIKANKYRKSIEFVIAVARVDVLYPLILEAVISARFVLCLLELKIRRSRVWPRVAAPATASKRPRYQTRSLAYCEACRDARQYPNRICAIRLARKISALI